MFNCFSTKGYHSVAFLNEKTNFSGGYDISLVTEETFFEYLVWKMEELRSNYTGSPLFRWQVLIQLLLILLVPFLLKFPLLQGLLCLVGLVFLGIPHGGNDFFIAKKTPPAVFDFY